MSFFLSLFACQDRGFAKHSKVRIRILAKDISITLKRSEDSSILNRLPVTVEQINNHSDETMAFVRLKLGANHLIARLTRKSVHQLALEVGTNVWAQIKSVAIVD